MATQRIRGNRSMIGGAGVALLLAAMALPGAAWAKKGDDGNAAATGSCGAYTVTGFTNGAAIGTNGLRTTAQASVVGSTLTVTGKYNSFDINAASFGIRDYVFSGAPAADDMTGGRRTLVWLEKTPDLKGTTLNGAVTIEISGESITITRTGPGVSMQIQAKDCASGGVFQMEAERADGATTRFTHILAPGVFYFDNPNFRAREGDVVPYKTTTVVVASRVNIANDASAKFLLRDSAQAATRVNDDTCANPITTRTGGTTIVKQCGRESKWDVQSGGRLGFVTGEDATEVAPPAVTCTHQCQAQDQVRGQSVVLGAPFPVPTAVRLRPDLP